MGTDEEMYREIVEASQRGIWVLDGDQVVSYVNAKAAEMIGYTPEEIIGESFRFFIEDSYEYLSAGKDGSIRQTGGSMETMLKCRGGERLFTKVDYKHKQDESGVYGGSHLFMDELPCHAEEGAKEKGYEKQYRSILEHSKECIFSIDVTEDHSFRLKYINPMGEKLTGIASREMSGKLIQDIFQEELAEQLTGNYRKCCRLGTSISYEEELAFPPGPVFSRTRLIPLKDAQGTVTRILGIASDVAELKLKEIVLQERMKMETVIAAVSRLFASQDIVNLTEILRVIGETVRVNRAYAFQLTEDAQRVEQVFEWNVQESASQSHLFRTLEAAQFPWWSQQLETGQNIVYSDIENLPMEAAAERQILKEQGIKSVFVAPILSTQGNLRGFIGFDDTEVYREWADEDAVILRVIAEMFGMYWERKEKDDQLRRALLNTQSMINNHEAVMLLIDPLSGRIIKGNAAACSFYGYTNQELLSMTIQDINALDQREVAELRLKVLEKGQKYFTFPHRMKSGAIKTVDVYSSPIDYDGEKVLFSIIFDVTEREAIARENEYLAYHDYLTGVYNRRYLEESFFRLSQEDHSSLAVIVGDINGLKLVNDSFGYRVGDELIREAAREMGLHIREEDILARISGDQFAVLMKDTDVETAGALTTSLEENLEKFVVLSNNQNLAVYLSVSFGYGVQQDEATSLSDLYEIAESYLYRKKAYNSNSTRSNLVKGMMSTLFQKSEREQKHSERVSAYCESIALCLGWDSDEVNKIRVAGKLHDIGKIGISEAILNKEGKLDEQEWEIMKQHTIKGASILEETGEYNDVSDVIAAHHERWDGTGYPKGLRGENVPVMARIIAVADAYDAMTQERTYRKPFSKEDAVSELIRGSGTQFDPGIVSLFISHVLLAESPWDTEIQY